MYIELDHKLVPRKVEEINEKTELPGRIENESNESIGFLPDRYLLHKYEVKQGNIQDIFLQFEQEKLLKKEESRKTEKRFYPNKKDLTQSQSNDDPKIDVNDCEPVVGPSEEVYYDEDLGFFSTILACYNNHWILKTSPDDWWNVIVRVVAQAIDENGDKEPVRKLFVDHEGKKEIRIIVPGSLATVDYGWLFDQFSKGIKENIKMPDYVDTMQADFSTTSSKQLISSQVMLMSSMQKYFSFSFGTLCGIPGVDMTGTEEDWKKLQDKTKALESMMLPIMTEIGLKDWFQSCHGILNNLLMTYQKNPDNKWWSHILSWNVEYGSGSCRWWDGWFIDFIHSGEEPSEPTDFQSGTVSVPVHIFENGGLKDDGLLVAGTVGFTVKVDENYQAPVVEANQAWVLLLPKNSPITPYLTDGKLKRNIEDEKK